MRLNVAEGRSLLHAVPVNNPPNPPRPNWFQISLRYIRNHPGDLIAPTAVLALAGITLFDVLADIQMTPDTVSRVAILVLSALVISQLSEQIQRRADAERRDHTFQELIAGQEKTSRSIASLTRQMQIYEIPNAEREKELNSLLLASNSWHFRGGVGRWQRSTVLPTLARIIASDVTYTAQIVDPRDHELCLRYAAYRLRRSVRAGEARDAVADVRADLLASVYSSAWYSMRSRVRATVTLTSSYGPFRYDVGSSGLILTVADSFAPAMFARKGGWFFDAVLEEIQRTSDELAILVLPRSEELFPLVYHNTSGEQVRGALLATQVRSSDGSLFPLLEQDDSIDFDDVARRCFQGR